jgi:MFS family permease
VTAGTEVGECQVAIPRQRNFRLIVACNVVSVTGSGFANVAVPFAVLRIGGSAADVGFVGTASLVPLIACLLLGGVVADRIPRHRVIVAANVVQTLAQAAAAILLLTGEARVWQLIVLIAMGGAALGFYLPAAGGLLPQTVSPTELSQANAVNRAGSNAAAIAGAALGGLVAGSAGPGWALAADALSFAIAGALRAGMRFPRSADARANGGAFLADLTAGWREFTSRRWLWPVVAQFAIVVSVSAAMIDVLGPLIAHASLGGASAWGLVVCAYAIGAVGGSLSMLRFRPRRIVSAAMLAIPPYSLLLYALAVPLPLPVDLAAAALAGACAEVYSVNWATALQQEIPADKLSRVSAYDSLGGYALAPVGTVIAGPLAAAFGTAVVMTAGGAVIAILPLLILLLVPDARRMRRRVAVSLC